MKILSNDYRSNLPAASHVAHGGPANFASAFSAYAVRNGHTWVGIIQRGHDEPLTRISHAASARGKALYECFLPESRYRGLMTRAKKCDPREWFAEEIAALRGHIRRVRPDVLFLNGFSVYAWLLLEAASKEGLPIVIQHAGIARVEFQQYRHLYSLAGRKMMLAMERDIVAAATLQVFLNAYSKKAFADLVAPVPARQARVIPLPFAADLATAARRTASVARAASRRGEGTALSRKALVIGCVARWDRIKNHRAVLRLAQAAKRQGLPWTFESVTKIPDTPVDARLKAAYRRVIRVVEPMEREALTEFYRSVDVLVLPSHFDVSPTVVMEAALMGKRTLISAGVGWNSEYREAGLGKWIADFSDADAAVRKLQRLMTEKPSRRFQDMVRTKHAPNAVFAAYLRAFADAKRLCA